MATPRRGGASRTAAAVPVRTRTLVLTGGSMAVRCVGTVARLVYASPREGYRYSTETSGRSTISVRFRSSAHESRGRASCGTGGISIRIRETALRSGDDDQPGEDRSGRNRGSDDSGSDDSGSDDSGSDGSGKSGSGKSGSGKSGSGKSGSE